MIYGPDGNPVLRSIEPGEIELAAHAIAAALAGRQPIELRIDAAVLFNVVAALQLALRHPGMNGDSSHIVRVAAQDMGRALAGDSAVLAQAVAMGWDRQYDELGMAADEDLALSDYTPGDLEVESGVPLEQVPEACPLCGCSEAMACRDDGTGNPCRWVAVVVCSACATNVFDQSGEVSP